MATVCTVGKDGKRKLEKHVWPPINSTLCKYLKRQENMQRIFCAQLGFSCCTALFDLMAYICPARSTASSI